MKPSLSLALILFSSLPAAAGPPPARPVAETLGRFVGEWSMELLADARTFGERGGPGTGTMTCSWGARQAWVDCVLDARYEGLGPYGLKIVLYRAGEQTPGAFVTNVFGGGRLYEGRWESDARLVFRDAWVDPQRKWEHQRTTYEFPDGGEIRYTIEVSSDDAEYLPHSSGIYRRK